MNVEQAIHERWCGWRPLVDLVPAERLYSGAAQGAGWPYVTLHRLDGAQIARTSSGTLVARVPLEFRVWDQQLARAQAVAAAIVARFNRAEFAYAAGRVLDCLPTGQSQSQAGDGTWRVGVGFIVRVEQLGT